MPRPTILKWDSHSLANFGKIPLMLEHDLHRHELFSDAALERLLESVERPNYYVNTMDVTAQNLRSRREGEIRDLSGAQVLEAVRNGQIWILLLKPDDAEPGYRKIVRDIYDEIAAKQPGFRSAFEKITILISSPRIQVYYHCDVPGQSLWQVRGRKTVYVYPNREPFLEQPALEKIVLGEAHEISLSYDAGFDQHATVFELQPGQMLHWPLNAPHRISNGDCVNVSFTTEHFTPDIRRMYHVNFANGVLRQRFGLSNLQQEIRGGAYWGKLGLSLAYRATGMHKRRRKRLAVDFRVDPSAPRGVRDIPAYQFQE
jgi:hypothetical protein